MSDLLQLDSATPYSGEQELSPQLKEVVTPLRWEMWWQWLRLHPDRRFCTYICEGIRSGFRIGFDRSTRLRCCTRNMSSATIHREVIDANFSQECAQGRLLGPFSPDTINPVHISPIGVIPKKTPGKWHIIVDLSSPEGASVNDGVSGLLCSLQYVSVEEGIRLMLKKGKGALLAKLDVQAAYRQIPVHPDDRWLLGTRWENGVFLDATLPFGLRSAPKIFSAVADATQWVVQTAGVHAVIHYLDDFLLVGAPASDECGQHLIQLSHIFEQLGILIAPEKTEGPVTCLSFLGLELDSLAMEIRLPPSKLRALQALITQWIDKQSCSRRHLESLIGSLHHACCVVRPGKTFLRRMFELLSVATRQNHHIRLSRTFKADLHWWDNFLALYNSRPLARELAPSPGAVWFSSDASGRIGVWGSWWIQEKWSITTPSQMQQLQADSITCKELLPIVLACAVWGAHWANREVCVQCDNQGAVACVNSGYSKVPRIMHLLRCLFFIRARFNIALSASYLPGVYNSLADAVSRDALHSFFMQVPLATSGQCAVPRILMELLVDQPPDWTVPSWIRQFRNCFQQEWPRRH